MFWGQWTPFWNHNKLSTFILCKNLDSNNFKMAAMCHFSAQILEYEIHRSKIWCLDLCFWNQGAQFYITLHFQPTSNAKIWYICVVTISKWPPWGIFVLISANMNRKKLNVGIFTYIFVIKEHNFDVIINFPHHDHIQNLHIDNFKMAAFVPVCAHMLGYETHRQYILVSIRIFLRAENKTLIISQTCNLQYFQNCVYWPQSIGIYIHLSFFYGFHTKIWAQLGHSAAILNFLRCKCMQFCI